MIQRLDSKNIATVINDMADACAQDFVQFGELNRDHFLSVWRRFFSGAPNFAIGFAAFDGKLPVGLILGLVIPDDVTGEMKAVESHWIVAPKWRDGWVGIKLLRAFEAAVKAAGTARIICGSYVTGDPARMRKLYARMGYTPYAEAFSKQV